MNTRILALASRILSVAVITACTAGVAVSDDTEIFTGDYSTPIAEERPNVLFIIDTSGSMGDPGAAAPPYDPNTTYSGDCESGRIYFTEFQNDPSYPDNVPDCNGDNGNDWVPADWFKCDAAMSSLETTGYYIVDPPGTAMAQWRNSGSGGTRRWRDLNSGSSTNNDGSNRWVECKADAGVHGDGIDGSKLYAADNGNSNSPVRGPWNASEANKISWSSNNANRDYIIWSPNYLNYYNNAGSLAKTKLEVVQDAAVALVNSLAGADQVNIALMRYSSNEGGGGGCTDGKAEGGMVLVAMDTAANNQTAMLEAINNLNASGCTPLSETLWEAYSYLAGASVDYGNSSRSSPGTPLLSITESRSASDSDVYKSPLLTSCQNNFIIYLTDGMPTADRSAESKIETLIGAQCSDNSDAEGDGRCLDDLAQYMYENDLRPTVPGTQNVVTYTIGFGEDVEGAIDQLEETASSSGGAFYEAANSIALTNALTAITTDIFTSTPTSFTAPAVSINAFNRTQNLNDLYVSIFKPEQTPLWPGNLKKYRLDPETGDIVDAATPTPQAAIDPTTGFFKETARSYWSDVDDGADVTKGGAAHEQPAPASRKVYSNLDTGSGDGQTNALTNADNTVAVANTLITRAMLGLAGSDVDPDPEREKLVNWLLGGDVEDDATEPRHEMGDPLHGRPATVIYGGTAADPDIDDGVVYSVTNAGYLHAIDVKEGTELWAFVPEDLLVNTDELYQNEKDATKIYGLDGDVKAFKHDVNNNGIVEPNDGDKAYLFFGMGRGGSEYYALDVTDKDSPVFLWKIGPDESGSKQLPGAGQSWSTPALARVQVGDGSGQNALKLVLIMGGGYDPAEDASNGAWIAQDTVGNQIFMVDAVSGNRLWYASSGTSGDLDLDDMDHAIPADVRVVDLTGDGLADRMYAADLGGRIWRFDIFNGEAAATLVAGGVFASLGNAHQDSHPTSSTRKFYNAPDVALLTSGGHTWINVSIGSGYRGHPLNTDIQDRIYSLRDHMPLRKLTQTEYEDSDVFTTITHATASLTDVTDFEDGAPVAVETGAAGWYIDLQQGGAWTGEKALSESRTVANMIQIPTWEPSSGEEDGDDLACEQPAAGTNRLYTVNAFNGAPVIEQNSAAGLTEGDRSKELQQSGIAPEVVWLFPSPENPEDCEGPECRPPPRCLIGVERCPGDISFNTTRTFWTQNSVN